MEEGHVKNTGTFLEIRNSAEGLEAGIETNLKIEQKKAKIRSGSDQDIQYLNNRDFRKNRKCRGGNHQTSEFP